MKKSRLKIEKLKPKLNGFNWGASDRFFETEEGTRAAHSYQQAYSPILTECRPVSSGTEVSQS